MWTPSSSLVHSFTRGCCCPHVASWHWGNHSRVLHLLVTQFTTCFLSIFFPAPALLTPSLNLSILPPPYLFSFLFTGAFFYQLPSVLFTLLCFSVMSRPTAGCHWVDGEKKWRTKSKEELEWRVWCGEHVGLGFGEEWETGEETKRQTFFSCGCV